MSDQIRCTIHVVGEGDIQLPNWEETSVILAEMLDTMDTASLDHALSFCEDTLRAVSEGLKQKKDYESMLYCLNYVTALVAEKAKRERQIPS